MCRDIILTELVNIVSQSIERSGDLLQSTISWDKKNTRTREILFFLLILDCRRRIFHYTQNEFCKSNLGTETNIWQIYDKNMTLSIKYKPETVAGKLQAEETGNGRQEIRFADDGK